MSTAAIDDYDHGSLPNNLTLSTVVPRRCVRIPTFQNDDEGQQGGINMESFIINLSPISETELPVFTPNSVEVRLFEQCVMGDVRLVNGSNDSQGRVELCFDGSFGTVCDVTPWTKDDASAVCRQLGFDIQTGTK